MKLESAPPVAAGEARILARPLIPVALSLITGLAAGAWGVRLPGLWAGLGMAALWVLMVLLWARGRGARLAPLAFFWLLGVAF